MSSFRAWLVVCLLAPAAAADAFAAPSGEQRQVNVCMQYATSTNFEIVARGRHIASQMYEEIGVHLRWTCDDSLSEPIIVQLAGDTPSRSHPGALAIAMPFGESGTRIVVYYDRLRMVMDTRPVSASAIMGHVLAHEIGHVLEGVARHAPDGVMRAQFTEDELATMSLKSLPFADENRVLIQQTVRARLAAHR